MEFDYLINLGFSLNEAKIYSTLLKHNTLNGYEISKFSGVNRSLVYGVIERMIQKGYIFKSEGDTILYSPLNYKKLLDKIKTENDEKLKFAELKLTQLENSEHQDEHIFNIIGYQNLIEKAKEIINTAKQELSLSIWNDEFILLKKELEKAIERNVHVYIFSFEHIELDKAKLFTYSLEDCKQLYPYRRMVIIKDKNQTIIGENMQDKNISLFTQNHSIVALATDEMVLNIFWYQMLKSKHLLNNITKTKDFLNVLKKLKNEFNIETDMTKNHLVFNYQSILEDEK